MNMSGRDSPIDYTGRFDSHNVAPRCIHDLRNMDCPAWCPAREDKEEKEYDDMPFEEDYDEALTGEEKPDEEDNDVLDITPRPKADLRVVTAASEAEEEDWGQSEY